MNVKNIRLSLESLSHGGPVILRSVAPDYEYDADNRRTDKVIGLRVTVVFPGNGYDTQTVKVKPPCLRRFRRVHGLRLHHAGRGWPLAHRGVRQGCRRPCGPGSRRSGPWPGGGLT